MKLQSLAIVAVTLALASCKCTTSDSSKTGSSGFGSRGANGEMFSDRVFFSFDKSTLTEEAKDTLEAQAKSLLTTPEKAVKIVGHCDSRGTSEYNIALGERRANASKEYLVQLGVPSDKIMVTSVGKEQPVVAGENEAAWAQNRTAITVE